MATINQTIGIVSPVPVGDWKASIAYEKVNIIRYKGASYIAKKRNQNIEPTVTSGWQEVWQELVRDGGNFANLVIEYQAGTSGTIPPTGEWINTVPEVPQGQYLWTRVTYHFADGTTDVAYSVSFQPTGFSREEKQQFDKITEAFPFDKASSSNLLVTHNELSAIATTGKLSDAIEDAGHRTVSDSEKAAWNAKQNALTFDEAPTAGSTNPVTSGGVKTAFDGINESLSKVKEIVDATQITFFYDDEGYPCYQDKSTN